MDWGTMFSSFGNRRVPSWPLEVGGVALGSKWNGGKTTRPCREDFSGYTNMVVQVDKNGYVEKIRVIRRIYATNPAKDGIKGGPKPTKTSLTAHVCA